VWNVCVLEWDGLVENTRGVSVVFPGSVTLSCEHSGAFRELILGNVIMARRSWRVRAL
jgi:hypothetical protein